DVFVYVVVILSPLVAVGMLWTRSVTSALWLFLTSMCAALLFGLFYHYVFISPDNIHHLPDGSVGAHTGFAFSAAILALIELATALALSFVLGCHLANRRTSHREY